MECLHNIFIYLRLDDSRVLGGRGKKNELHQFRLGCKPICSESIQKSEFTQSTRRLVVVVNFFGHGYFIPSKFILELLIWWFLRRWFTPYCGDIWNLAKCLNLGCGNFYSWCPYVQYIANNIWYWHRKYVSLDDDDIF